MGRVRVIVQFTLIGALVAACSRSEPRRADSPDTSGLRARIDALYEAEKRQDWSTWYELIHPRYRPMYPYEAIVGRFGSRDLSIESWDVGDIDVSPRHFEDRPERQGTACVDMYLVVRFDGEQLQQERTEADCWGLIDGEWFWEYRALHEDEES